MNKSEFWNYIWINIKTRIPPPNDNFILLWNPERKEPFVMRSYEAHQAGRGILEGEFITWDRFFVAWCPIEPPMEAPKEKKKSRRTK